MKVKRIMPLLLSFLLIFGLVFTALPKDYASAATKTELEKEIQKIDAQIKANKKKIDELKGKKESQKEYLNALEAQIDANEKKAASLQTIVEGLNEDISVLDTQIKGLNKEIKQIQGQIKQAETDITSLQGIINDTKDSLSERLRAAYMKGSESTIEILMGADNFASFLTRLEMMKRTTEKDKMEIEAFKDAVEKLNKAKKALVDDKKALDEKKASVNEKKISLVKTKSEYVTKQNQYKSAVKSLENQYATVEKYISSLDKTSTLYENYISKLQKEKDDANAEIDRILKEYYATKPSQPQGSQGGSSGSYASSGTWGWPLGGASCYISSHFGYRSASISGWSFHGGTDIAGGGIYGKPVYASRAGKVITAVTSNSGYGIYVLIDHGDGYSTLYGHMSARYVNTGDSVSKGQMIGRVGSTGNSTGPHLHFEVRYYGEKKNPMNYVKKP